jgi:hypothetical protein
MTNSLSVGRRILKSGLSVRLDLYTPYCEWDIGNEFLDEISARRRTDFGLVSICNELHKSSISFSQVGISFQILSCRGERLTLTH